MGKRGKQANELAVVESESSLSRLPSAPTHLDDTAAEIWAACVNSKPSDWYDADALPLLEAYCRHVSNARHIAAIIQKMQESGESINSPKDYETQLKNHERETRAAEAKATKLRITNQSRWEANPAARKAKQTKGGPKRPWEG